MDKTKNRDKQMEETKNRNYNERHPELKEGEMFLTNFGCDPYDYTRICWKTKRKGYRAYTINGEYVEDMTPIFVQRKEYEDGMKKYKAVKEIKKMNAKELLNAVEDSNMETEAKAEIIDLIKDYELEYEIL